RRVKTAAAQTLEVLHDELAVLLGITVDGGQPAVKIELLVQVFQLALGLELAGLAVDLGVERVAQRLQIGGIKHVGHNEIALFVEETDLLGRKGTGRTHGTYNLP